ncbi:S-adenosyl-L-methionine-dependent methyltransferases superfamily protein [Actinidia rufa]|uniref:S-adenosyl-L-methionine-dependent methyltransferases superfamily protein n=1 Tax=Actinidia rufa TaxID=165716 RepID=A0A7J0EJV8_9ERIC|nr:S-adenosyl-L-methionine-dependent methyltransferases superfamily protein [Actinidia rufa]
MAKGKTMEVGETCPMNGGDGPYSYSQNSHYQREAADAAKTMIMDSILDKLDIQNLPSNTLKIADFGCSVGANTFQAVQNIIDATKTFDSNKTLEFQVFFNDLTGNDFNNLFTQPSQPQGSTLRPECPVLSTAAFFLMPPSSILLTPLIHFTGCLGFRRKWWIENPLHGIKEEFIILQI